MLKVTVRFYGGYKYKSPSMRRRDKLRKEKFLAKFRRDPILMPIPFLKNGQTPTHAAMGAPIHTAISTAFITHAEEMVGEMKRLHDKQNCLAQEAEDAEKERARMSNWVLDLKDQRAEMERELCQVELETRRKKGELAQLKARKREWEASSLKGPVGTSSVSGLSRGVAAETRAPKKKKSKQKRLPGLPLQEGQEHYKLYLAHL